MPDAPQSGEVAAAPPRSGGVRTRLITAVVLVVILVAVLLWMPPAATVGLVSLAIVAGAWEWSAFVGRHSIAVRLLFVALIAALLPAVWWWSLDDPTKLRAVLTLATLWWVVALAWLGLAPQRVNAWKAALAGALTLVPAWLALVHLRLDYPGGGVLTLFSLALVWAADTGAFFAGRRFGRVKLAPRVSPGKTWEGVFGAMLLSGCVAAAGAPLVGWPTASFIALALGVVAFSIVGDLTESMFKRYAGLKDSGQLFPGHGGVLDRIDSITAALPPLLLGLMVGGGAP